MHMRYCSTICVLLTLFFVPIGLKAQKQVQIVNADLLEFIETDLGKMKHLTGNVHFIQDDIHLYCDIADEQEWDNQVIARGNVHLIQNNNLELFANQVQYYSNEKRMLATGNVRLIKEKATLSTNQLTYNTLTKVGTYDNGGTLVNDSTTLSSQVGYYYSETGDAYFRHNVILINPNYKLTADTLRHNTKTKTNYFLGPTHIFDDSSAIYCEGGFYDATNQNSLFTGRAVVNSTKKHLQADSIYYFRTTTEGRAFGHVLLVDTLQQITLRSKAFFYNSNKNTLLATRQPLLKTMANGDSIFIASDTIYAGPLSTTDTTRILKAWHHAKLYKSNVQGIADSISYSFKDSTFRMYTHPVLWSESNQLVADTIHIQTKDNQLHQIRLYKNAIIASAVDTALRFFNQLRGKTIYGTFANQELSKVKIKGNGQSIYYNKNAANVYDGVNKVDCSDISIQLKDGQVKQINFYSLPDAIYSPMRKFKAEDFLLKDFVWLQSSRPTLQILLGSTFN